MRPKDADMPIPEKMRERLLPAKAYTSNTVSAASQTENSSGGFFGFFGGGDSSSSSSVSSNSAAPAVEETKTDFWGNGKLIKELGPLDHHKPIHIKFGEPMKITGNGKEENQRIIDFIKTSLEEWNMNLVKKKQESVL